MSDLFTIQPERARALAITIYTAIAESGVKSEDGRPIINAGEVAEAAVLIMSYMFSGCDEVSTPQKARRFGERLGRRFALLSQEMRRAGAPATLETLKAGEMQ